MAATVACFVMLSGTDRSARRILALTISSDLPLSAFMASSSIGLWFVALTSLRRWDGSLSPRAGADRPSTARPAPVRAAVSTNILRDNSRGVTEGVVCRIFQFNSIQFKECFVLTGEEHAG
jgi:hypothetical protein